MRFQMINLFCVVFVLQVLSEDARELDCASLCEQVDSGLAGICCGKINKKRITKTIFEL